MIEAEESFEALVSPLNLRNELDNLWIETIAMTGLIKRGLVVAGAISLGLLSATATVAETSFPSSRKKDGSPDRRQGIGSRCGTCAQKGRLFALVPESNASVTLQVQPAFTWYVPKTPGGETLTFQLTQPHLESEQQVLYEEKFQLDGTAGVMHLSLAEIENAPILAKDEQYVWTVILDCNPQDNGSGRLVFKSSTTRIAADRELTIQIQNAGSLLAQAKLYADRGLWPDALDLLLQEIAIQADSPIDKKITDSRLKGLLTAVGLEFFADQPMMQTYDQPGHDYQPVEDRPETWISNKKEPPQMASVTHWAGCGGGPATAVYADS